MMAVECYRMVVMVTSKKKKKMITERELMCSVQ
jgi:hypothetical protein